MSAERRALRAPRSVLLLLLATGCSLAHDGLGLDATQPDGRDDFVLREGGDERAPTDASDAFDVGFDGADAGADAGAADADAFVDDDATLADSGDVASDVPVTDTAPRTGHTGEPCDPTTGCLATTDGCIDLGAGATICAPCGGPGQPCCRDTPCATGSTATMLSWNFQTICTCTQTVMGSDPGAACYPLGCGGGSQCSGAPGYCVRCGATGQPCCALGYCGGSSCSSSPSGSEWFCR